MNKEIEIQDDEIDLIELFKVLWSYKFMIIAITTLFGVMGYIYAQYIATPKYKVSATFENGYYRNLPASTEKMPLVEIVSRIESLNVKWIKSLVGVPNLEYKFDKIELLKDDQSRFFINVITTNNDIAISKIKEILVDLQKEDEKELAIYKQNIQNQIDAGLQKMDTLKQKEQSLMSSLETAKSESKNVSNKVEDFTKRLASEGDVNVELALSNVLDLQTRIENKILSVNDAIATNKTDMINQATSLKTLEVRLSSDAYNVTQILSNIVSNDNPTQPKKAMILVVCVFIGFFISMFSVFLLHIVKKYSKG